MQVFVKKSDLASMAVTVPVIGHFNDLPWIDRNTFGASYTPLTLPPEGIVIAPSPPGTPVGLAPPVTATYNLASDWRNHGEIIANGEAQRRILESFSEFMQRNATQDQTRSMATYSTSDISIWPADARARYQEAQRGYNYISAVRNASDAIASALPPDPTDNAHWPTIITPPIYIPYV